MKTYIINFYKYYILSKHEYAVYLTKDNMNELNAFLDSGEVATAAFNHSFNYQAISKYMAKYVELAKPYNYELFQIEFLTTSKPRYFPVFTNKEDILKFKEVVDANIILNDIAGEKQ